MRKICRNPYFIVGLILLSLYGFKKADDYFEVSKNLEIFGSVYKEVYNNYVDEVQPGELMKTGIDAMLSSLDPYTNYYTESQAEDAMIMRSGSYGGIGCSSIKRGSYVYVTSIIKDMAADKSGMKVGDIILEVNGKDCIDKSVDEVGDLLRGAPNSKASVKVKRVNTILTLEVVRQEVKINNVSYYGIVGEQIGYIKLDHFMQNAAKEVREAFVALKLKGIKNVILDLRDNGGGLLHEAVNIVNIFVDGDKVVTEMRGRTKESIRTYKTLDKAIDIQIPLIVLVNNHSASASEIVSGSLQDLDRGVIIGQNTFGKGLVQNTRPLPYGSQMKITIAKYYIPSGRCIQQLDYSHKNADGKAQIMPDSLRKTFYTQKGRKVLDGGGIRPDLITPLQKSKPIVNYVQNSFLLFDFVTNWMQDKYGKNLTMDNLKSQFQFSDFTQFCDKNIGSAPYIAEKAMEQLSKQLKEENLAQGTQDNFVQLTKTIQQVRLQQIKDAEAELTNLIIDEIIRRYEYAEGAAKHGLMKDVEVQKATETFQTNYSTLLLPTP